MKARWEKAYKFASRSVNGRPLCPSPHDLDPLNYSEGPMKKLLNDGVQESEENDAVRCTWVKTSETRSECPLEGPKPIGPWCPQQ